MNITQGGRKIGYAQRNYCRTEDGFRFSENIFMRINTMGIVQPLTVRTDGGAETRPDALELSIRSGVESFQVHGPGRGCGEEADRSHRRTGRGKDQCHRSCGAALSGRRHPGVRGGVGLKPGEGRTFPVFDPASLGQRPVRITLLGEEALTIMGKSRQARKLSVDFMGMKQIAWVDPDGSVLREEGILGIVLERVTREEALAGLEGAVSADLTEIAAIPSSKPIEDAAALKVLKIRLEGLPEGPFFLDGGRQVYRNGVLTIRRESPLDPSVRSGGAAGGPCGVSQTHALHSVGSPEDPAEIGRNRRSRRSGRR